MTATPLSPEQVLQQVAQALPADCRADIIIVGSLAAGCHFFHGDQGRAVRTKGVDCMLAPHARAVASAERVAEALMAAGWSLRSPDPTWSRPGRPDQPTNRLPLVRLQPPGPAGGGPGMPWFIELLGAPSAAQPGQPLRQFERLVTPRGHFGLCSFGHLGLAEWQPLPGPHGLRLARPSMMALANLLHHPSIGPELMSGSPHKRANKDLGRVLALAYLASRQGLERLQKWVPEWAQALAQRHPREQALALARQAVLGLQALLQSPADLAEAARLNSLGLLASFDVGLPATQAIGRRVLALLHALPQAIAALPDVDAQDLTEGPSNEQTLLVTEVAGRMEKALRERFGVAEGNLREGIDALRRRGLPRRVVAGLHQLRIARNRVIHHPRQALRNEARYRALAEELLVWLEGQRRPLRAAEAAAATAVADGPAAAAQATQPAQPAEGAAALAPVIHARLAQLLARQLKGQTPLQAAQALRQQAVERWVAHGDGKPAA